MLKSLDHIELTETWSAHNYSPLDVVLERGEGVWVWDVEGRKYLDMLSAYSALSFGHRNKRIHNAAVSQMERLTLSSRAFYNDQFGLFCKELAELCEMEAVLPMNSGAEAVETAIKLARKWGYEKKGVEKDKAEIICFADNFHGRTTTIISFSDSEIAQQGFGPFTPGFKLATFGDIEACKRLINKNTVAILFEPIQGEGGVLIPPVGFIKALRKLTQDNNILLIADEIQTGLCRTGRVFACEHEEVKPDLYILGKSLGGGIVPLSAVIGPRNIMDVFTPGTHGSTFGGNPLAAAIGREVIAIIHEEQPQKASKELGEYFLNGLKKIKSPVIEELRGRGLFIGIDIKENFGKAKPWCKKLKEKGLLCKDTREQTIRFAPALTIDKIELDWALETIAGVLG